MRSENPNRLRAEGLVSLLPGIHLRMLSRLLGLGESSTRHHLGRLERDGRVTCSREGAFLRAYPSSMRKEDERRLYALLQHSSARRILGAFTKEHDKRCGLTNEELSTAARLSQSTVSEYMSSFRSLGVVRKVLTSEGRWTLKIEERQRRHLSAILSDFEKNLFTVATDSFIDLWDF
jgi:predicted transcriptional regulator